DRTVARGHQGSARAAGRLSARGPPGTRRLYRLCRRPQPVRLAQRAGAGAARAPGRRNALPLRGEPAIHEPLSGAADAARGRSGRPAGGECGRSANRPRPLDAALAPSQPAAARSPFRLGYRLFRVSPAQDAAMNLEPTEEQRQIVASVRRFVREEIVPLEAKLDPDASELPKEEFDRLTAMVRDMGFWGLDI